MYIPSSGPPQQISFPPLLLQSQVNQVFILPGNDQKTVPSQAGSPVGPHLQGIGTIVLRLAPQRFPPHLSPDLRAPPPPASRQPRSPLFCRRITQDLTCSAPRSGYTVKASLSSPPLDSQILLFPEVQFFPPSHALLRTSLFPLGGAIAQTPGQSNKSTFSSFEHDKRLFLSFFIPLWSTRFFSLSDVKATGHTPRG